jgi:hypothetical protein
MLEAIWIHDMIPLKDLLSASIISEAIVCQGDLAADDL